MWESEENTEVGFCSWECTSATAASMEAIAIRTQAKGRVRTGFILRAFSAGAGEI